MLSMHLFSPELHCWLSAGTVLLTGCLSHYAGILKKEYHTTDEVAIVNYFWLPQPCSFSKSTSIIHASPWKLELSNKQRAGCVTQSTVLSKLLLNNFMSSLQITCCSDLYRVKPLDFQMEKELCYWMSINQSIYITFLCITIIVYFLYLVIVRDVNIYL